MSPPIEEENTGLAPAQATRIVNSGAASALGSLMRDVSSPPAFRKPNDAIMQLRVIGDRSLGLMHRRILNVMLQTTQSQMNRGRIYPPFAFLGEKERSYYWAPFAEYCKGADYTSRNLEPFREAIQELQTIRFEKRLESRFLLSEVPIASVRIEKVGREYWVGVAFAPESREEVQRPQRYTEMSTLHHFLLRSSHATQLYEVCRRYATNKTPYTHRAPWSDWYYMLSGKPKSTPLPELKYWKRDTLKKAEEEINSLTDLAVTRREFKASRSAELVLQYEVHRKDNVLRLADHAPPDPEILSRMMRLGVPQKKAFDLAHRFDQALIRATLDLTEKLAKESRITTSNANHLERALEGNWVPVETVARHSRPSPPKLQEPNEGGSARLRAKFTAMRNTQAYALFNELPDPEQRTLFAEFMESESSVHVRRFIKDDKVHKKVVQGAFSPWYALKLWGEPTDAELIEFACAELENKTPA